MKTFSHTSIIKLSLKPTSRNTEILKNLLSRLTRKHLLIAAAAAAVLILLVLISSSAGQKKPALSPETAQTRKELETMESRDVRTVREQIESLTKDDSPGDDPSANEESTESSEGNDGQASIAEAAETNEGSSDDISGSAYLQIFSDSLFMGDSVIHDLDVYGLVNSSNIIAENGVSLEELEGEFATAAALAPRNIFLYYGFNDIGHVGDDYESFRYLYENLLIRLREVLPDAAIYANSLFPVHDLDTLQNGWYGDVSPYNAIIADLCAQYGITYLDHSYLVSDEYYYDDGYHFIYEFYPLWLDAMAREAGLLE